ASAAPGSSSTIKTSGSDMVRRSRHDRTIQAFTDTRRQSRWCEWFRQKRRPQAVRSDAAVCQVRESRYIEHADLRTHPHDALRQVRTVHARHDDVAEQQVELAGV